ncbi:low molecular weight protein-tyrosine-phosphatase [Thioalkalicoccus limnaeus]|uniref:protein-tyrosine-phosphatase n=1 Tax=Thioalkalicoccus limnaeus TaxID=120681 RepID=A0ABV4BDR2_9GAMM
MNKALPVRVLFVCMGNICRSPTAEGVFGRLIEDAGVAHRIVTDSAGTHAYHVGDPPDPRAQKTARARGIDLSRIRARQVVVEDFASFHYVLAMDDDNRRLLAQICPRSEAHKLKLFMDFAPEWPNREVPDPYYGGPNGFERVFDMVEAAAQGLLADIRRRHLVDD